MKWGDIITINHVPREAWLDKWEEWPERQSLVGKVLIFAGELRDEPLTLLTFKSLHGYQDVLWPTGYVRDLPKN